MTQRLDRINPPRAARRNINRQQHHDEDNDRRRCECSRIGRADLVQQAMDDSAGCQHGGDTDRDAGERERGTLTQHQPSHARARPLFLDSP